MDQATAAKILENKRMPLSAENINRIMSMGMGRGEELLGSSMGLQGAPSGGEGGGGLDLNAILSSLASATDRAPMVAPSRQGEYGEGRDVINPNSMTDGNAQNGSAPPAPAQRSVAPRPTSEPRMINSVMPNQPDYRTNASSPPTPQTSNSPDILQQFSDMLGIGSNSNTPKSAPPPPTDAATMDGSQVEFAKQFATPQEYAMAVGIPLGLAATIFAAVKSVKSPADAYAKDFGASVGPTLEKYGPRSMVERDMYPGQTPGEVERLRAEVAAENTAAEKPIDKVARKTAKAPPRTAVPNVSAGPDAYKEPAGPTRDNAVVNDGKVRTQKMVSDAALGEAQKPSRPVTPSVKPQVLQSNVRDLPRSIPVEPDILKSLPVEGTSTETYKKLLEALKEFRKLRP